MQQVARTETIVQNPVVAGCVAVSLYALGASLLGLVVGTNSEALGQVALGGVVVFALVTAIRGVNRLLRKQNSNPASAVATDVIILLAGLLLIVLVGSFVGRGSFAVYSIVVVVPFIVPAIAVVSVLVEVASRSVWVTRLVVTLACLVGLVFLGIYAIGLVQ